MSLLSSAAARDPSSLHRKLSSSEKKEKKKEKVLIIRKIIRHCLFDVKPYKQNILCFNGRKSAVLMERITIGWRGVGIDVVSEIQFTTLYVCVRLVATKSLQSVLLMSSVGPKSPKHVKRFASNE